MDTYFVSAAGNRMIGDGIFDGTMLVVDTGVNKLIEAQDGDSIVALINGLTSSNN